MPECTNSATAAVEVSVNGNTILSPAPNLAELLIELGYGDAKVATAVNGDFVASRQRAGVVLKPGDHIEIVAPRQGG